MCACSLLRHEPADSAGGTRAGPILNPIAGPEACLSMPRLNHVWLTTDATDPECDSSIGKTTRSVKNTQQEGG